MRTLVQSLSSLGRALRDARKRQGLNQSDLALRAGVTQAMVSHAERGTRALSIDTLLRLIAALKLELVLQPREQSEAHARWRESQ